MAAGSPEPVDKLRVLNCDVAYYKVMHARAAGREAVLKQRVGELEERCARQEERIKELLEANEKFQARVAWLEQQLFGRKSEQTEPSIGENPDDASAVCGARAPAGEEPKKRGKQPGAKGYGRKRHDRLPTEEIPHELPPNLRCCPRCGEPFEPFPGTEDSDELDWDVRLTRRVHKRARYRPACQCGAVPGIVAAPPPQRTGRLHLVINNARFLVLPWIKSPNLASRILGGIVKRVAADWRERYKYSPVLLETFVEKDRFRGTCYRAANWILTGQTQGRGKLDRHKHCPLPVKDIFLYPLARDFRRQLCAP